MALTVVMKVRIVAPFWLGKSACVSCVPSANINYTTSVLTADVNLNPGNLRLREDEKPSFNFIPGCWVWELQILHQLIASQISGMMQT